MILPEQLKFTKLNLSQVGVLNDMALDEGWNPGTHDAEAYFATDPDGFYGYFHEGELIAGGSIVSYGGKFGFMGFFIVRPDYRGHGIGRRLWYQRRDTLLSRLEPGAAIGMDGVVPMQPFYQKGGFEIAFRDERYEKIGEELDFDPNVVPLEDSDFEAILALDTQCFGFARPQFLRPWLKLPGLYKFKYSLDGQLRGYALMRPVNRGFKICPLFADNINIAEALYRACLNSAAGHPVFIDIPVVNKDAVDLVRKYDTSYVFECARMYYGKPPEAELDKVFGITTFELG